MSSNANIRDQRWTKVWDVPSRTKNAAERHQAVLALGTVQALRQKRMSTREAWENGLNFKTYMDLKKFRADRRLLELWKWAMELPQVEKLGDAALIESLDAIERLAAAVLADRHGVPVKVQGRPMRTRKPTCPQ